MQIKPFPPAVTWDAGQKRKQEEPDLITFDARNILKEVANVGTGLVKSVHLLKSPKYN